MTDQAKPDVSIDHTTEPPIISRSEQIKTVLESFTPSQDFVDYVISDITARGKPPDETWYSQIKTDLEEAAKTGRIDHNLSRGDSRGLNVASFFEIIRKAGYPLNEIYQLKQYLIAHLIHVEALQTEKTANPRYADYYDKKITDLKAKIERMKQLLPPTTTGGSDINDEQQGAKNNEKRLTEEQEIIADVIKIGGLCIDTCSWNNDDHNNGWGPMRYKKNLFNPDKFDATVIYNAIPGLPVRSDMPDMRKHDIREVVVIQSRGVKPSELKKNEISNLRESSVIQGPHGGNQAMLHSEVVKNGNPEPGYSFLYYAGYNRDNIKEYKNCWFDHSGRPGNRMYVRVDIPKGLAENVFKRVNANPAFARKVVEGVVKKILPEYGMSPNSWEDPNGQEHRPIMVRPPYEKWASEFSDQALNMYIHGPDDSLFDPGKIRRVPVEMKTA